MPGGAFHPGDAPAGRNTFQFAAVDVRGHTATTSHTLVWLSSRLIRSGLGRPPVAGSSTEYHHPSFHPGQNVLYADAALTNTGPYAVGAGPPRHHQHQPSRRSRVPARRRVARGDSLLRHHRSRGRRRLLARRDNRPGDISFNNPHRVPFTYDLVLVGAANHARKFNSVPPVSVADDREYRYQALAIDPDGDG